MSLPELHPDALHLFVSGPGVGELVAVHAPPGEWMVVDGCSASSVRYGVRLLQHYGALPRIIILTHPHVDHAMGVAELIDYATAGRAPEAWPVIGMVAPPQPGQPEVLVDMRASFEGGVAQEAIAAIFDRWERVPRCKAELHRGDMLPLGEAMVRVLAPAPEVRQEAFLAWKAGRSFNSNRIATVLAVEWKGLRLLLGSDMVEEPGGGWSDLLAFDGSVSAHAAFKVPHHGSRKALHPRILVRAGAEDRPEWVVTPFASRNLPRFSALEGVDVLLQHVPRIHLTGLPRAFETQGGNPAVYRIEELQGDHRKLRRAPPVAGFPDCMVVLSWRAGEQQPMLHSGVGSVTVVR